MRAFAGFSRPVIIRRYRGSSNASIGKGGPRARQPCSCGAGPILGRRMITDFVDGHFELGKKMHYWEEVIELKPFFAACDLSSDLSLGGLSDHGNSEQRTSRRICARPYLSAVRFNNGTADRQTHAQACCLGRVEGIENAFQDGRC